MADPGPQARQVEDWLWAFPSLWGNCADGKLLLGGLERNRPKTPEMTIQSYCAARRMRKQSWKRYPNQRNDGLSLSSGDCGRRYRVP
jgi:hypothetical protein